MIPAYPDRVIYLVSSKNLEWMVVHYSVVTAILSNPSTMDGSRMIFEQEI